MSIKVILAEDRDVIRQSARPLLENDSDIEIVAEAVNCMEALELCGRMQVDLIVMDIHLQGMSDLECTRIFKKQFPQIKVLILSMHNFENDLVDILKIGADGYILKDASRHEMPLAIKKIMLGGMYIGSEFTLSILEKYIAGGSRPAYTGPAITESEIHVLELIAQGFTNTQMANKLFISVRTIESRRKKLLEKTDTTNTATLIKFAIQHGLIK